MCSSEGASVQQCGEIVKKLKENSAKKMKYFSIVNSINEPTQDGVSASNIEIKPRIMIANETLFWLVSYAGK